MSLSRLTSKDTLIVLTFAKAGLGHLRVAYALMEGFPAGSNIVLFSSIDTTTTFVHRLTSVNPIMRGLAEAFQHGLAERVFTKLYTRILRLRARLLLPQLEAIVSQQKTKPKRVVFVSTHFGLAHQIGELKAALSSNEVKVKLVVVVTDDSPQLAWSVPEADLTTVPSRFTRLRLNAPNTEVVHYPLSLRLGSRFVQGSVGARQKQADPSGSTRIRVSLPVSGAAVGLNFYRELTSRLSELEPRFSFFVSSRDSAHTRPFLARMSSLANVEVNKHEHDREVVSNYIKILQKNTIAFEVTKPSEQAFKALYAPWQLGGVILLLSSPIGRQEYDNLWFLARNNLIPSKAEQEELWRLAVSKKPATRVLLTKAKYWRGLRLMNSSEKSALFINWCLEQGVFKKMMEFKGEDKSDGVKQIWGLVDAKL